LNDQRTALTHLFPTHLVHTQLHGLQQQLALVSENPLLGIPEAAELIAKHLGADLVG